MDLAVKSQAQSGIKKIQKQGFQLKTSGEDCMVLQIHHTVPEGNGELRRIRFMNAGFCDTNEQLAATDHKGNIFIVDLSSCKFWLLANVGMCTAIAFSPYKKCEILVATQSGVLDLFNIDLIHPTGSLQGHMVPVSHMSFAQDRYCLAASSQEAIIWDLETNTQAHRLSIRSDILVKQVLFMPLTNHILACFQDDAMHIWNFGTFEFIKQIVPEAWKSHHIKSFAFTRNGRAMVIGGHSSSLVVLSLDNWSVKKVIELPDGMTGVSHIEFVPQIFDGGANKVLGILSANCIIKFLNIESYTVLPVTLEPGSSIRSFLVTPNGKFIAVILRSGEINIYATYKLLHEESLMSELPAQAEKAKAQPQEVKSSSSGQHKPSMRKLVQATHQQLDQLQKQIKETLDLERLRPILKEFGEYPESYRGLIWKTILLVPGNQSAYVGLVNRDCHPSFLHLEDQYPLENRSVLKNLKRLLSCLAHWSALFGEVKFLPLFVFPFVRVFQNDPFTCFEAVATIIVNWCQFWFEYFPYPPVNILAMIENVLNEHDPELLAMFYEAGVTSRVYAWPLLEVAFSEVLSTAEWLKFWDHVLSNEPCFLLMAVVAYNISCRGALRTCHSLEDFEYFFHNQNPIDMKHFIAKTYTLCRKTSEEIHPQRYLTEFTPLSKDVYPVYNQYPKYIVDFQAQQMEQIRNEEEKILQEQQKLLEQNIAQERRYREDAREEVQEARLLKLEEAYRETIQKEEERVADQRRRILNFRRDLRSKELDLLDAARDKLLRQHTQQRHLALDRLLDDVARKRVRDETEVEEVEEEMKHHYTELLIQKRKLQDQIALSCEAVRGPSIDHRLLQEQQEQLKLELLRLREEATAGHHNRQVELTTRIAVVDELLQRVEMELAREMAERQNHLISSEGNIKVLQLETETRSLEMEVEKLLNKLSDLRLQEGKTKLQEAVASHKDRYNLHQEQKDLVHLKSKCTNHLHSGKSRGTMPDWISNYMDKRQYNKLNDLEEHERLGSSRDQDQSKQRSLYSRITSPEANRYTTDPSNADTLFLGVRRSDFYRPQQSLSSRIFSIDQPVEQKEAVIWM